MFDVIVSKVNDTITIRPNNASDSIWKDDFTLSRVIESLNFIIFADNFFMYGIIDIVCMIFIEELHVVMFFIVLFRFDAILDFLC